MAIGLPVGHCAEPMLTLPLGTKVLLAPEDPTELPPGPSTRLSGRLHLLELGVTEDLVADLDE